MQFARILEPIELIRGLLDGPEQYSLAIRREFDEKVRRWQLDPGRVPVVEALPHHYEILFPDGAGHLAVGRDGGRPQMQASRVRQASDLLAALVRGGVRVSSFSRRREGLEDVFLKVGARELG